MFSLHIIANAYVPSDPKYEIDAHNIKIIKYSKLLKEMGYIIHFYGASRCEKHVQYDYYHSVISIEEYDTVKKETNDFTNPEYLMLGSERLNDIKSKLERKFFDAMYNLLSKNYKRGDFVLHFFQNYTNDNDMINIRMAHGGGTWNMYNYVSFETNEYMEKEISQTINDKLKVADVIYPWFDSNEFIYDPGNKYATPTYLYMARCHMWKGIHHFLDFSRVYLEYNFIIAGGTLEYNPDTGLMNIGHIEGTKDNYIDLNLYPNVKYIGPVFGNQKKELLSRVTALIQPTCYFEPCGWNVLEAMISGTPVLVPNFGGFIDTVIPGITGYLNRSGDWIANIEKVRQLKPIDCLTHVVNNFNKDSAKKSVKKFFDRVLYDLTMNNER